MSVRTVRNGVARQLPCLLIGLFLLGAMAFPGTSLLAATTAQALALKPIQSGVDYARPSKQQVEKCTIKPEKNGEVTSWVVRDAKGEVLRRFSDSNQDNVVDIWSYFQNGVEVYRDLDTNFDSRADQYRWFHSAGVRWGIDEDQDGEIETWRSISPHEVAEEVVRAIKQGDQAIFNSLLLTEDEIKRLGAGRTLRQKLVRSRADAPSKFRKLIANQQTISAKGRFVDFGAARPSLLPAGTDESSRDIMVYQNVSALVDESGKAEQVQIGLLVKVGQAWRLVEAPQIGDDAAGLTIAATLTAATQADDNPTEQMQALMSQLEQLDRTPPGRTSQQRATLIEQRVKLLRRLTAATPRGGLRDQWLNQLADMLSAAVVEGDYKAAHEQLNQLDGELKNLGAGSDAQAHVRFQRIYTNWVRQNQDSKGDYPKVQSEWRESLQAFTKEFPNSTDSAEALLQLGMVDDLAGRDEEATKWYRQLSQNFDGSPRAAKAAGALRRLESPGKVLKIRGTALDGKRLGLENYRGKHVLVQYWASWCEPCKEDMATLQKLSKQFSRKGFAVLGVNLDNKRGEAQQFVHSTRLPWRHLHEPGGLEGRLANEMGIINLPLMLLVDDTGKVLSRNIRADELENELRRILK